MEQNFAIGCLKKLDDDPAQCGFAASGFAHNAQGLALLNGEADIINRVEHAMVGFKILF